MNGICIAFGLILLFLNSSNSATEKELNGQQQEATDHHQPVSVYKPQMMVKRTYSDGYVLTPGELFFPGDDEINSETVAHDEEIYLCPAEAESAEIETISKYCPTIYYCLFEKKFQENEEKSCNSPVRSILIENRDIIQNHSCDTPTTKLYTFALHYCATLDDLREEVRQREDEKKSFMDSWIPSCFKTKKDDVILPPSIQLYHVCYNTLFKYTNWTKHEILLPLLLEDGSTIDEPIPDSNALSTEQYSIPNQFSKMDDAFNNQNTNSPDYMVPRMLVPKQDLPFVIWKTATSHYLNIAPLLPSLQPLMDAIDNGIRKAAITLKKRLLRKNSMRLDREARDVHSLKIYTTTYLVQDKLIARFLDSTMEFKIPDIWCKVIFHEGSVRGIAVFVHNTPSAPEYQIKQCQNEVFCDFKEWTDKDLDAKLTKFAYCCMITRQLADLTFPNTEVIGIRKLLDIQDLIEGDPQQPLDHPLTLRPDFYTRDAIEREALSSKMLNNHLPSADILAEPEPDEIHLCPAEEADDEEAIKYLAQHYWGTKVCLIQKAFVDSETKICKKEIEPIIISDEKYTPTPQRCGPQRKDSAMKFVYAYCFTRDELQQMRENLKSKIERQEKIKQTALPDETPLIEMYDICYNDNEMRTVYTRHRITSPDLLGNANSLNENAYECKKISVEPYKINDKFSNMRIAFKYQDKNNPHRMIPQMLVPPEHLVLPLWQKTTCHYINVEPLWYELEPLMNLINTRIRNWAIQKSRELVIYTATFDFDGFNQQQSSINYNQLFPWLFPIPNVWRKLVYDDAYGSGVAIVIHNTPDNPPTPYQLCEGEGGGEKEEKRVECDFKNWSEKSMPSLNTTDEYLQYAYCCRVTDAMKELYEIENLEIVSVLDLNDLDQNSIV